MMKLIKLVKTVVQLSVLSISFVVSSVYAQYSPGVQNEQYIQVSQQIYIAMYGRPADQSGLIELTNALKNMGAPTDIVAVSQAYDTNYQLRNLIDGYQSSYEFNYYNSADNGVLITNLYHTLFNRYPDAGGYAYWKSLIDSGSVTRSRLALAIMAASMGNSDGNIVGYKTYVATGFTRLIDSPSETSAYWAVIRMGLAREWLAGVGVTTRGYFSQGVENAVLQMDLYY